MIMEQRKIVARPIPIVYSYLFFHMGFLLAFTLYRCVTKDVQTVSGRRMDKERIPDRFPTTINIMEKKMKKTDGTPRAYVCNNILQTRNF